MAILCRCEEHKPKNTNVNEYVFKAEPLGFPNSSSICGRKSGMVFCEEVGYVYMTEDEAKQFRNGKRIFSLTNNDACKIRVNDTPLSKY